MTASSDEPEVDEVFVALPPEQRVKARAVLADYRQGLPGPLAASGLVLAAQVIVQKVRAEAAPASSKSPGSRRPRMVGYVFNPDDVVRNPEYRDMNLKARGAFRTLADNLWYELQPGVVADRDRILANLAGASEAEWADVREVVSRLFDLKSMPGFWVLPWMVRALTSQDVFVETKRAAGRKGAEVLAQKRRKRKLRLAVEQSQSKTLAEPTHTLSDAEAIGIRNPESVDQVSGNPFCVRGEMLSVREGFAAPDPNAPEVAP